MAIDWDSFELGSSFTRSQAKSGHFDLTGDFTRSSSRQEKVNVGSGFPPGEFDIGSALTRRHASNESRLISSMATDHNDTHDDEDFL